MDLADTKAVILSLEGTALSDDERSFFAQAKPLGFILFARNCETPVQLKALIRDLRGAVGWECPILIDQEGGRVQRLKPPQWRQYDPMKRYGDRSSYDKHGTLDDLRYDSLQLSEDLLDVGIDVNCAPVLDVLSDETHDAIGDRAFSDDPEIVAQLGLAVCRSYLSAGIVPVMKHMPGHGRATSDSHKDLPHVDVSKKELSDIDFRPFRIVAKSDIGDQVWGMIAHIVYDDIDPDFPSSASAKVIHEIIRDHIGFYGLLLSDDLDMDALAGLGDVTERALRVLEAGCDVALYCSGRIEDMQNLAKAVPNLSLRAQEALQNSAKSLKLTA